MNRWVEFVEPFNEDGDPVYCRISPETAIKHVRKVYADKPYIQITDEQALEDFMVVHWAEFVDVESNDVSNGVTI